MNISDLIFDERILNGSKNKSNQQRKNFGGFTPNKSIASKNSRIKSISSKHSSPLGSRNRKDTELIEANSSAECSVDRLKVVTQTSQPKQKSRVKVLTKKQVKKDP